MKHNSLLVLMTLCSFSNSFAGQGDHIVSSASQPHALHTKAITPKPLSIIPVKKKKAHASSLSVQLPNVHPELIEFYPTALIADNHVVTYIAGTPVVTAPYLGSRPAFDGSDYIVNISSINRDIRLMEQRRRLYQGYRRLDYPQPDVPVVTFSGKVEPMASLNQPYQGGSMLGALTLGSSELDAAALLNDMVEGFIGFAYNESPQFIGGPRVANAGVALNMGFVNIGNLDKSPIYFTGGQLYAPFGRYSSSMISATLPMVLGRTKSRPFILGYKSQHPQGPFLAVYGFQGDTTLGGTGVGGVNAGYVLESIAGRGELGISYISSINNSGGMQLNGATPRTTFGGFASLTNGSEAVRQVAGLGIHAVANIDRYSLTAEWVQSVGAFRPQDLSFNGDGAKPSAGQLEGAVTFHSFDRPSSVALGYQWTNQALALNLPKQRLNVVYNISIWRDTVESVEYRYDRDYSAQTIANGATAAGFTNLNTMGTGHAANTLLAQIGVYF